MAIKMGCVVDKTEWDEIERKSGEFGAKLEKRITKESFLVENASKTKKQERERTNFYYTKN